MSKRNLPTFAAVCVLFIAIMTNMTNMARAQTTFETINSNVGIGFSPIPSDRVWNAARCWVMAEQDDTFLCGLVSGPGDIRCDSLTRDVHWHLKIVGGAEPVERPSSTIPPIAISLEEGGVTRFVGWATLGNMLTGIGFYGALPNQPIGRCLLVPQKHRLFGARLEMY